MSCSVIRSHNLLGLLWRTRPCFLFLGLSWSCFFLFEKSVQSHKVAANQNKQTKTNFYFCSPGDLTHVIPSLLSPLPPHSHPPLLGDRKRKGETAQHLRPSTCHSAPLGCQSLNPSSTVTTCAYPISGAAFESFRLRV